MKKLAKRFLAAALVLAMVCAMIPAAMAAVDDTVSSLTVSGITAASNRTYTKGDAAAALTVTVTPAGTYTYQWYKANGASAENFGTAITNANTNTYTPSTAAVDDSWYYCRVTSDGVSVDSARAHIQVIEPAYTITLTKSPTGTVEIDDSVALTARVVKKSDGSNATGTVTFSASGSAVTLSASSAALTNGTAAITAYASKAGSSTVTATYSSGSTSYTASVSITVAEATSNDSEYYIEYYVDAEEAVELDENDFQDFFEKTYKNGDLEYVKFTVGNATNYGTSSYGYLYESDATKASKVSGSTRFYYDASAAQNDLSAVVFTAGTRTNAYTVKIPFTATGKYKSATRSLSGTLVIEVNSKKNVTITLKANQDGYVVFSKDDMEAAISNATGATPDYISFSRQSGGTLYKSSESMAADNKVGKEKYYFSAKAPAVAAVIFFAGADRFATKSGSDYVIEFDAYALDENTGTLTAATYTFKSANRLALANMAIGFYEVYISDSNEISLVTDVNSDGLITSADLIAASAAVAQGVLATDKRDVTGNYIVAGGVAIDGGDADVVTYNLDGFTLKNGSFADLANGDTLYVYKSTDTYKFTIVNAAMLAATKAVDTNGSAVLGVVTSADQTIGHTYEGMTISNIPTGMEVKSVAFGTVSYTSGAWENDSSDIVTGDITITLDWLDAYKVATLKATVAGLGTTVATSGNGTIQAYDALDYTVSELLEVLEAGLTEGVATVELKYGANFVDADSSLHFTDANKGSWTVVVTSGNGLQETMYVFGDNSYSAAPAQLQSLTQSTGTERQMLDGVCFRLDDSAAEHYVEYTAYDAAGTPIAGGRIMIEKAEVPPTVTVGSARVKAGKTVQIPVRLEQNPGFADLSIEIGWDASVMTLESVEGIEFGGVLTTSKTVQSDPYLLNWVSIRNISYNGTLALLNFSVREDAAEGTYPITVQHYRGVDGANRDGEDVNFDENHTALPLAYENGSVTVLHYTPGDTTGDDKVTSRDASYILQYLAGWDVPGLVRAAMDVDGNERVNSWDAILLLRYIAGWDVELH